jgi:hypothetical protein
MIAALRMTSLTSHGEIRFFPAYNFGPQAHPLLSLFDGSEILDKIIGNMTLGVFSTATECMRETNSQKSK